MKYDLFTILLCYLIANILVLLPLRVSHAKNFDDRVISHISYPEWFNHSPFYELQENLNNSRVAGKKGLMVLFTTEGCSYCDKFIQKSLGNPEIASIIQKNFDSVGLEIFDGADLVDPQGTSMSVSQFAENEKVGFSPTLLFYGDNGKRILRLAGYQSPERFRNILNYIINDQYRSESLRAYLNRQTVNATQMQSKSSLKADPIFTKPPYALGRNRYPASKPLLVIFEKQDCKECKEFHSNVLAVNEVRKTLNQFEVVRLDADDVITPIIAPGGKRITPALWYDQTTFTRVPAMVFFDENGNEALKTDALVLRQRMMNSLNFMLEQAYKIGSTYQRFARTQAIERRQGANN